MSQYDNGIGMWLFIGVIAHLMAKRTDTPGSGVEGVRFYQICYWIALFSFLWKLFIIDSGTLIAVKATFVIGLLVLATASWFKRSQGPHWKIVFWLSAIMGAGNLVVMLNVLSDI